MPSYACPTGWAIQLLIWPCADAGPRSAEVWSTFVASTCSNGPQADRQALWRMDSMLAPWKHGSTITV